MTSTRHRRAVCCAGAAIALLLPTGCGGDDDAKASDPSVETTSPPTTVMDPEGFPVFHVEDREEARFELVSPDWLRVDEDHVWVKRDDGGVERIDPETNEVDLTIRNEGAHCAGLGIGFGSVWTCTERQLSRFDAVTGEPESTLPVEMTAQQGHLPTEFGRVWVLTGDGSTLLAVDPQTETVVLEVALGARGTNVDAGESGLWVVSTVDDQVLRIDPVDGRVVLRVTDIVSPVSMLVTDEVWVGAARSTSRIDPETGDPLVTSDIGVGSAGSLARTGDALWVRSADRFLTALDPETGLPTEGIASPDTPSAGDSTAAFGSLWTSAFDDGTLFRIDPGGAAAR